MEDLSEDEKTSYRVGGNICKLPSDKGLVLYLEYITNFQNSIVKIQTIHLENEQKINSQKAGEEMFHIISH